MTTKFTRLLAATGLIATLGSVGTPAQAHHAFAAEFGAPYSLLQKGLRRTDFELGTEVVVNGFLAKSGEPVLNASNVTLPDGRDFLTAAEDSPGVGN